MTRQLSTCYRRIGQVAILLFPAAFAFAQDALPASGTIKTERITVTGSNIPTAEDVGPNPVLTIDRDAIEKSGERTAEDLIRNLTVAGANGVPASNNAAGFTPGASSISLRGFDPSDTLTLIDGRRVATYPLGANGTESFVDLKSIPSAAIESIEILKDSASSIYGADAVAGVVNIKLRHDYRGAETNLEYGNTLDKDSGEIASSLLFGLGNDSTNVTGVLNYYRRNSIFNRDRDYSAITSQPSSNTSPANLQLARAAVIAAGGNPSTSLGDTFFGRAPFFTAGNAPAPDYSYAQRRVADFNFNAFSDSLGDSERYGGLVKMDHKIFGERMKLYADVFYQKVKTRDKLAPSATGDFETPGNVTLAIPPHAPGATLGGPSYGETGVPVGAFNPFNPFQQIISGGTRARLIEFGDRIINSETDAFLSTLGVKGDQLFGGSWGYDAAFRYSQIKNTLGGTFVSASRFDRILNAANPIFDPASSEFIGTTVPYNPFGDFRKPISTNAASIAFATIHPSEIDLSKLATLDFNLYTTSLFNLPAGGVGLALGGQFRRESLQQNPDQFILTGDIIGTTSGVFTSAGRNTYAFYTEADLPIFSPAFSAAGFHALEFTAAMRFEEFLSNSTNVLVPKFGLRWQPFDDSLTVRATWGEGFHQASLFELFGSPSQFLSEVHDPVNGEDLTEVTTILRSNSNLQPEDSRSFSGGIVYTPKFLPSLTLTIDLFDIESTGRVNGGPPVQGLVDRAAAGRSLPNERVNRDAEGNITSIELAFANGGSQKARGVDFALQYEMQTRFGTFTSLTQATYLDSFQFAALPGEPELELRSGVLPGALSDDSYLKWKASSQVGWAWHGLNLTTTVFYRDGFHEMLDSGQEHYVKQTWFFDVQLTYAFSFSAPIGNKSARAAAPDTRNGLPVWKRLLTRTTITLGCNNLFDHDPPKANTTTNYPDFLYDSTGRFVYVSLTKKF